jgi:steroid delta-isomerase-like uncharacterized protein
MSTEQNKSVVRRWIEEVTNNKNLDMLNETHASNSANHALPPGMPQGIEGEKRFSSMFFVAFPDGRFTIQDLIAEENKVAMRYIYRGTHTGNFQGIQPTGKSFEVSGINLVRISNGKIAENWVGFDQLGLLAQLGVSMPH